MYFKPAFIVAAFATLAAATPTRRNTPASQCNTGPVQCCNSVEPASSANASKVIALLGIVLQDLTVEVGLTCTPISVLGVGGDSCTAQAVCCENNSFNGVIAIGCSPVDLSL